MFNKIYDKIKTFMKENGLFLFLLVLILVVFFVRLPFEVEMPGGIIDLGNRVTVNGETTEIEGSFNMAYVSVVQGSIPYIALGLVLPDWDVNPESSSTLENETVEEANVRNKLSLEQSKDYATIAAMKAANIDFEVSGTVNYVAYIGKEAKTGLKVGDNILKFNGQVMNNVNEMSEFIQTIDVGEKVEFVVSRDGKEVNVDAIVYEEKEKNYLGISVITTFDINSDVNVEITSKESESGPSGGLMMTLMVYNALTNQDLTHGKKIVGTGTINVEGEVGEIGGVKYKLMGAVKQNASVFLVPEDNYEEALDVKRKKSYDIDIVSVKTLQDAIDYLEGL